MGWLRIWVALIKLEGIAGVEGFGGWLRIWVALIKLKGNWGAEGFGVLRGCAAARGLGWEISCLQW